MCPDTALAQLSLLPLHPADHGTELKEKGTELMTKGKLLSPRGCGGCGREDMSDFTLIWVKFTLFFAEQCWQCGSTNGAFPLMRRTSPVWEGNWG